MVKLLLMSLWPLIISAAPPTPAIKCDYPLRAGLPEPSDTPEMCIYMQEAVLPPSFRMSISRTACDIGEVSNPGNTTTAQVASHIADQWDYG